MKVAVYEIYACYFSDEIFSRNIFYYFALHRDLQIEVCKKLPTIILEHEMIK
jgi:hypothetical protein